MLGVIIRCETCGYTWAQGLLANRARGTIVDISCPECEAHMPSTADLKVEMTRKGEECHHWLAHERN